MVPVLFAVLALGLSVGADELHVSQRKGDDTSADGSVERPYRTLTSALAAARAAGRGTIRVDLGTYGAEETFPLPLSTGIRIVGLGSDSTSIDAAGAPLLFAFGDGEGTAILDGLTLKNAVSGVLVTPVAGLGRTLVVNDVRVEGAGVVGLGFDLGDDAALSAGLRAHGLRVRDCGTGLAVQGAGRFSLDMTASTFDSCINGVLLDTDPEEDRSLIGQEGAPEYLRVAHDIDIRSTSFLRCKETGLRRLGADGKNDGPPYELVDCLFQGNDIGIELRRPCGDTGLVVRGSRFLENTHFGLMVTGYAGDPERTSLIQDSLFQWNGVGAHVTSSNFTFRRDRFVDNLGNGIFASNFLADPTFVEVSDSLLANNGACGVYTLADARLLTVRLIHDTIVFNGQYGVYNKTRHAGTTSYEVRGCIVAGNTPDLGKLEPENVLHSLIGDGTAVGENESLAGDPGFVAPELRDYRLRPDSACVDRGGQVGDVLPDTLDLDGLPRYVGPRDLGAFERQD